MDSDTNKDSGHFTIEKAGNHQTAHPAAATVSQSSSSAGKFQISSNYTRKVERTTDIAGRLPNAVYTLPPHIVQAIVGLADVTATTRMALVAECKKFYLADRHYEESKEVFVDGEGDKSTTITLDCGRLYAEGNNEHGQCGIGSEEGEVTGPRLIRIPPVLRVWCDHNHWFAKTTRGLFAWGDNTMVFTKGVLGIEDDDVINQPRRVPIDSEVLDVFQESVQSFFRTSSGWLGCGYNNFGQLGLGLTNNIATPTPIPGSEGVTRWAVNGQVSFAFSEGGLLASGINGYCRCGVGSSAEKITTLTSVALPDDVKGRVDRVVIYSHSTFFISGRRCFGCGYNGNGELGIGSDEGIIRTPIELPVPVDDIISNEGVTVIRSGDTLLACGSNRHRLISTADTPEVTTPTPPDLPGPVVRVALNWERIFIQLTDGAWVGQGRDNRNYFTPVHEADLIDERFLPGWTPVTDTIDDFMNDRKPDDGLMMVLPEPIANA